MVRQIRFSLLALAFASAFAGIPVQGLAQSGSASGATSLQEGWYKIIASGQQTGFLVQRIAFDKSTNRFTSTSFTQTNALGGNLRESLVAVTDSKLLPVSFQYTSQAGSEVKTIDAAFTNESKTITEKGKKRTVVSQLMTAKVKRGDTAETLQTKLEPGTFLSQFLVYVMLQSPKGLKQGNNFVFNAVTEENAEVRTGEAFVSGMEKYRGIDTFKILVTFKDPGPDRSKDQKFINYVTPQGIILMTKAPTLQLSVEMTTSQEEATKGFEVNQRTLNTLFGTMPKSPIQEAPAPAAAPSSTPSPTAPAGPTPPASGAEPKASQKTPDPIGLPPGVAPPPGKGN